MSRIHGIVSLLLILLALGLALVHGWRQSPTWGLAYVGALLVAFPTICYAYCAKCPCRQGGCSHVLPGVLTRILPARNQGPYEFHDYAGVVLPLLLLMGLPLIWLVRTLGLLIAFWCLVALALVEIRMFVCGHCTHINCPLQRGRSGA